MPEDAVLTNARLRSSTSHAVAPSPRITELLLAWNAGDRAALDALMPLVTTELRRLARGYLRRERAGHTLQPTAIVNEAYLRLVNQRCVRWQNRAHFFAMAATLIRRIMIDYARRYQVQKRGGGAARPVLEVNAVSARTGGVDFIALDEALAHLATLDPRQARVVELRFFGGLTVEETAVVLKIDPRTVKRDWSTARAWLYLQLSTGIEPAR